MPIGINPIKKAIVKAALLQGISARQALKKAHYSDTYAHSRSTNAPCVRVCNKEIMTEAKKRGIIDKAWNKVDKALDRSDKLSDNFALNLSLKDMTEKHHTDLAIEDNSNTLLSKHRLSILHP